MAVQRETRKDPVFANTHSDIHRLALPQRNVGCLLRYQPTNNNQVQQSVLCVRWRLWAELLTKWGALTRCVLANSSDVLDEAVDKHGLLLLPWEQPFTPSTSARPAALTLALDGWSVKFTFQGTQTFSVTAPFGQRSSVMANYRLLFSTLSRPYREHDLDLTFDVLFNILLVIVQIRVGLVSRNCTRVNVLLLKNMT